MESVSNPPSDRPVDAGGMPVTPARNKRKAPIPYDGRYAIGRRVRQLTAEFRRRLGPEADDVVTAAAIRRASEMTALAESLRAALLRGEPVSIEETTRATRAADMLTRRLRLDRQSASDEGPRLSDLLREDWERQRQERTP